MARPKLLTPNYHLRQNVHGVWYVHWTDGNTRKVSTKTKDRSLAEKLAPGIIAKIDAPKSAVDIAGVIEGYLDAKTGKVRSPKSLIDSLAPIAATLGTLSPFELTSGVLDSYVAQRRASKSRYGTPYSDSTIQRELNALRGALSWAAADHVIASEVKFRIPSLNLKPRDRWLTRQEVKAVLKEAPPHLALFIRIALATLARRDAILELKWDQVTIPEDAIHEHHVPGQWEVFDGAHEEDNYVNAYVIESLGKPIVVDMGRGHGNKHRSTAVVGDNLPLYLALVAARKVAQTPYVIEFRGRRLGTLKKTLETTFAKAGVDDPGHHVFKHTGASLMVQAGVPWDIVSNLSGTSVEMLKRTYARFSPDNFLAVGRAVTF